MSPRAVLVGLPGAGKTTTGRRLASRLRVAFADSDALVEQRAARSVREIFAADGEDAFRVLEAEVIAEALARFDGVLALGGGAVITRSTRDALVAGSAPVILLRSSVRALTRRVGSGRDRPLLTGDTASKLRLLATAREPLYREVATHVVRTDHRSSSRVAAEIVELLGHRATQS